MYTERTSILFDLLNGLNRQMKNLLLSMPTNNVLTYRRSIDKDPINEIDEREKEGEKEQKKKKLCEESTSISIPPNMLSIDSSFSKSSNYTIFLPSTTFVVIVAIHRINSHAKNYIIFNKFDFNFGFVIQYFRSN